MKKGNDYTGVVERVDFQDKGIVCSEDGSAAVKDCIEGQKILFRVKRKRAGRSEGQLLSVLERSPLETEEPACPQFGSCGSCKYQTLPYEAQLQMKEKQVKRILDEVIEDTYDWQQIEPSPSVYEYRNKMEFSFGNEYKDGPLTLGLHKKGGFYDIIEAAECRIVDGDFRKIVAAVQSLCRSFHLDFFHKVTHKGYLRHLLVRKAAFTGELLVDLITTSQSPEQETEFLQSFVNCLTSGHSFDGMLVSVLHTVNDSTSDVVQNDGTRILFGTDHIVERLLGLQFEISAFSFFQTNSRGAERLYTKARDYVGETKDKVIFDLYSGTGTIAQLLAPVAHKVIGIEIIPEAVDAARTNARENGLVNCEFLAGDVFEMLEQVEERPDFIVLDPPRDGVQPKALQKILCYGADKLLYISCKPTSLARDLVILQEAGYRVEKAGCVDMFPMVGHVETIVGLQRRDT